MKIFISTFVTAGGEGRRGANYGFINGNKYPPLPFPFAAPPPHPHFKGTFAIFPQGYFIMTSPVYENLEKYPPTLLIPTPSTTKHKRVLYLSIYFFGILLLFFIINFVFLSNSFLFFWWSIKFRIILLTNQKKDLVVSNCHGNCILITNFREY